MFFHYIPFVFSWKLATLVDKEKTWLAPKKMEPAQRIPL
ncbi:hypothetical protein DSBG_4014 [Desulfosporosinus sp. BG]|nr:hypothetical protein DSBG_4014 [Desulfosporosinus sp. BG]